MSDEKLINVGLVDDHLLLRNALASLIDRSGRCQVVIQSNNGKDFITNLREETYPDILLLDMNMPEMDGYETALWLKTNHPKIKILEFPEILWMIIYLIQLQCKHLLGEPPCIHHLQ